MERKLQIIFFIFLGILALSCEKKNGFDFPEAQLKVKEANIIFESEGGAGYIELMAPSTITAQSNSDWCTATVSGTTVNLSVEPNVGITGRSATITIHSEKESITVTALQAAAVMWLKDFPGKSLAFLSEGETKATALISSFPIEVVDKPEWISYKIENDSLYLTAGASIPRKGQITFSSAGRNITYEILQVSYAGMLGDWELQYTNPSQSNRLETTTITFEEKEKNISFWLKGLTITGSNKAEIIVDYSATTNNTSINAGQFLMIDSNNMYIYLCLRNNGGSYTWSGSLAGTLDIADDATVTYSFVNPSSYNGIGFYLFNAEGPSSATSTGRSYRRLMNMVMTKL